MLTPKVAEFLRNAHADSSLAEHIRSSDSYEALEQLSGRGGPPARAAELRVAFTERNAGVLARQMMRHGLMDTLPLPSVPAMDNNLRNRVVSLDLGPVGTQLVEYVGWTAERAAAAERRYRRFLYLKAVLPDGMASPTEEIDQFWHQHIINTQRYGPDCQRVAGRFLHHTFLSPNDPVQAREIQTVWLATWICYEMLFEEPYEESIGAALLNRGVVPSGPPTGLKGAFSGYGASVVFSRPLNSVFEPKRTMRLCQ